jgi:hypothetical protein
LRARHEVDGCVIHWDVLARADHGLDPIDLREHLLVWVDRDNAPINCVRAIGDQPGELAGAGAEVKDVSRMRLQHPLDGVRRIGRAGTFVHVGRLSERVGVLLETFGVHASTLPGALGRSCDREDSRVPQDDERHA